jgi:hypothetical protein
MNVNTFCDSKFGGAITNTLPEESNEKNDDADGPDDVTCQVNRVYDTLSGSLAVNADPTCVLDTLFSATDSDTVDGALGDSFTSVNWTITTPHPVNDGDPLSRAVTFTAYTGFASKFNTADDTEITPVTLSIVNKLLPFPPVMANDSTLPVSWSRHDTDDDNVTPTPEFSATINT